MLSMCLLFCFVVFWILCCVVCEKIKKLLITKKKLTFIIDISHEEIFSLTYYPDCLNVTECTVH